jgi:hypothetical protein
MYEALKLESIGMIGLRIYEKLENVSKCLFCQTFCFLLSKQAHFQNFKKIPELFRETVKVTEKKLSKADF